MQPGMQSSAREALRDALTGRPARLDCGVRLVDYLRGGRGIGVLVWDFGGKFGYISGLWSLGVFGGNSAV